MEKKQSIIKKAFVKTIPIMAGYLVLGAGFGILLQSKGFGVIWALAASLFIYAGSMQYLTIDLLAGGAGLVSAAITALMVNARHIFYGISMVSEYKNTGKFKPYLIFSLTDETYSLVCEGGEEGENNGRYYFWVSFLDQIYWVAGSVIGSLVGKALPFSSNGMDFALTALFITVFVEQWTKTKRHEYAVIGVVSSIICLLIFGADKFLIPSMLLILAAMFVTYKKDGGATNE